MIELELFDVIAPDADISDVELEIWNITQDGEPVGNIQLVNRGNTLEIAHIDDTVGRQVGRSLGTPGVRKVLRLLKKEFPQATQITGRRVTGIRTQRPEIVVRKI